VPTDGLYAANSFGQTQAYAALLYEVSNDPAPRQLTLQVAPNTLTTPNAVVRLCPLVASDIRFKPAQGGDAAMGPKYDCQRAVVGTASADGKSFSFDIHALVSEDLLAVAVVAQGPFDRVVFSKPVNGALSG